MKKKYITISINEISNMSKKQETIKPNNQVKNWSVRFGTPDCNIRVESAQKELPGFMRTCEMPILCIPSGTSRVLKYRRDGAKIFITLCHPDDFNINYKVEMELVGIPILPAIEGMFAHNVLQSAVGWTDSHSRAVEESDIQYLEQNWHPNITEHILRTYMVPQKKD